MQVKKNGMKLMRDTASLTNALIESTGLQESIKPGDTFVELHWTDRTLWVVTKVVSQKEFFAKEAETYMKNGADGTEYPVMNDDGSIKLTGQEMHFKYIWKNWRVDNNGGRGVREVTHLSFGKTTGYRDPFF